MLTDFGEAVLQNLEALVPVGTTQADLALELGLCAWMHQCDTELDEALDRLWDVRGAVLVAGGLDPASEPIPFGGRNPQAALVNLAIYLGNLLGRASAHARCDPAAVVDRAGGRHSPRRPRRVRAGHRRLRELRTSWPGPAIGGRSVAGWRTTRPPLSRRPAPSASARWPIPSTGGPTGSPSTMSAAECGRRITGFVCDSGRLTRLRRRPVVGGDAVAARR